MIGQGKNKRSRKILVECGTEQFWTRTRFRRRSLSSSSVSVTPPVFFLTWPWEYKMHPCRREILLQMSHNPGSIACHGTIVYFSWDIIIWLREYNVQSLTCADLATSLPLGGYGLPKHNGFLHPFPLPPFPFLICLSHGIGKPTTKKVGIVLPAPKRHYYLKIIIIFNVYWFQYDLFFSLASSFKESIDLNKNSFWSLHFVLLCPLCQHALYFFILLLSDSLG